MKIPHGAQCGLAGGAPGKSPQAVWHVNGGWYGGVLWYHLLSCTHWGQAVQEIHPLWWDVAHISLAVYDIIIVFIN